MNTPTLILRQDPGVAPGRAEARAIMMAGMLCDVPIKLSTLEALEDHRAALKSGALPVGSVEFVREAMRVAGIDEPENMSYPAALKQHLQRDVRPLLAGEVCHRCFVKPVRTKLFTGFVFDPEQDPLDYEEHDIEQLNVFVALSPLEPVWVSEPVKFAAEWRVYVIEGRIAGVARYDPDGSDDVADPDDAWLRSAADALYVDTGVASFAIDVGRLEDGRLALVEVNDGWAIGLYGRALDAKAYLQLLWVRWKQIAASVATVA